MDVMVFLCKISPRPKGSLSQLPKKVPEHAPTQAQVLWVRGGVAHSKCHVLASELGGQSVVTWQTPSALFVIWSPWPWGWPSKHISVAFMGTFLREGRAQSALSPDTPGGRRRPYLSVTRNLDDITTDPLSSIQTSLKSLLSGGKTHACCCVCLKQQHEISPEVKLRAEFNKQSSSQMAEHCRAAKMRPRNVYRHCAGKMVTVYEEVKLVGHTITCLVKSHWNEKRMWDVCTWKNV